MPHPIIIPDLHGREFWREVVNELPEDARVGSIIWANIDEFAGSMTEISGIVQICGHTKCPDGQPKAYGNVICTDCQKAFVITEEGIVGF